MTARPFALVRAHAATLDGTLGDDLRELLASTGHPDARGDGWCVLAEACPNCRREAAP